MTATVPQTKEVLMAVLADASRPLVQSGVTASNIQFRRLPDDFENDRKAVVVTRQGGRQDDHIPVDESIFTIRCYGGSTREADVEAVADAVVKTLHSEYGIVTGQGNILNARVSQRLDREDLDFDRPAPMVVLIMEVGVE